MAETSNNTMELDFRLEIKGLTEKGTFSGFASVYDITDRGGDVVERGAFTRTLAENGKQVPLLWQHDMGQPIGLGDLTDASKGLMVDGALDLDVQAGQEAYSRMRKGIVKGLSIGYRTVREDYSGKVRLLKDVDLYEVSLVVVPMNAQAQVTSIKSQLVTVRDFERWLRDAGGFSKADAQRISARGFKGLGLADDDDETANELSAWLKSQSSR